MERNLQKEEQINHNPLGVTRLSPFPSSCTLGGFFKGAVMREITAEDHERLLALIEKYKTGRGYSRCSVIDYLGYCAEEGGAWLIMYNWGQCPEDEDCTKLHPTAKEAIDEMEQILIKKYGEKK